MISNQSSQYSNIRAVKTLAIILGCIYISAWTAHLLFLTFSTGNDMLMVGVIHSFASRFISLTGSKLWAYAISAFNILFGIVWLYGVCTTSKTKKWLFVLTKDWLSINLVLFILFWIIVFNSYGMSTLTHSYPYIFVLTIFAIAIHLAILSLTCTIYKSFHETNRQQLRHVSQARNPDQLKFQDLEYGRGDGHSVNYVDDWHSSPSFPSHDTSNTHNSHDTHTSSHDTHTSPGGDVGGGDSGGCSSSGFDSGGCSSGGCDSGGGTTCD